MKAFVRLPINLIHFHLDMITSNLRNSSSLLFPVNCDYASFIFERF